MSQSVSARAPDPEGRAAANLASDYARSGFGHRLGFGQRPALLVVDFVNAYLEPGSPLYAGVESALSSASRVLAAARRAGIPVIFTKVVYREPTGADGGPFFRKARGLELFVGDTNLGSIVEQLTPRALEVVLEKKFASAFFGTDLASRLRADRIDSVVICGLSTSGCVRATAVDAVQHGLIPLVVREAVGDRDPRPHEASLFDLDAKYADVVSEAQIVTYLHRLPEGG